MSIIFYQTKSKQLEHRKSSKFSGQSFRLRKGLNLKLGFTVGGNRKFQSENQDENQNPIKKYS